jgi:uncharacterized protein (TIGR04255 family)
VQGPDFRQPPVEEVALSMQFAAIDALTTAHVARYWESVRRKFPRWMEARPIETAVELFGASRVGVPRFDFAFESGVIPHRALFEDEPGTELVQVQRDRFVRNWRRLGDSIEYPRYATLRERFREDLNGFVAFLEAQGLEAPIANQCEVTYVNHLPVGAGWDRYGQVDRVFRNLANEASDDALGEPETVEATLRYVFPWPGSPEPAGRLHVQIRPAQRFADGAPILAATLTARGRPRGTDTDSVIGWLDVGHDFLVRSFAAMTTRQMHEIWGRRDE